MLVQLRLKNFRSFRDEAVFTFLNTLSEKEAAVHPAHLLRLEGDEYLTRGAALYGANASGKSNLLAAFKLLRKIAENKFVLNEKEEIYYNKCDANGINTPVEIEICLLLENQYYYYGIAFHPTYVSSEWVSLSPSLAQDPTPLIERNYVAPHNITSDQAYHWSFEIEGLTHLNPAIKIDDTYLRETRKEIENKYKKSFFDRIWAKIRNRKEQTGPYQRPFLVDFANDGIKQVSLIKDWIINKLLYIGADRAILGYINLKGRILLSDDFRKFALKLITYGDTGISDIKLTSIKEKKSTNFISFMIPWLKGTLSNAGKWDISSGLSEIQNIFNSDLPLIKGMNGKYYESKLEIYHNHSEKPLSYKDESDGTKRLFDLLPLLYLLQNSDVTVVIDELDMSIHTALCQEIVRSVFNKIPGQFIFTTHDTNLIDPKLFRADEIWFIDKDSAGASHLTCLSQFQSDEFLEDLAEGEGWETGYLRGRFGGLPSLWRMRSLNSTVA